MVGITGHKTETFVSMKDVLRAWRDSSALKNAC